MPGPAANPNARRPNASRNRPAEVWRKLPAEGRRGEPPAFPLGRMSKAVAQVWADLWSTPQAVAWEELGWTRVVARYAKLVVQAEKSDASAALLGEVRQLEDRLGLSPLAMRRNYWVIADRDDAARDEGDDMPDNVASLDEYRALFGG